MHIAEVLGPVCIWDSTLRLWWVISPAGPVVAAAVHAASDATAGTATETWKHTYYAAAHAAPAAPAAPVGPAELMQSESVARCLVSVAAAD